MKGTYFAEVLRFTFRGFVPRTDALQIILASAAPAIFQALGVQMPEGTSSAVLAYIAYVALAFLLLRFLSAPYFIWREQNNTIAQLQADLALPEQIERRILAEQKAVSRQELAACLAEMKILASIMALPSQPDKERMHYLAERAKIAAAQIIDDRLNRLTNDFVQRCYIIFSQRQAHEHARETVSEMLGFYAQLLPMIMLVSDAKPPARG